MSTQKGKCVFFLLTITVIKCIIFSGGLAQLGEHQAGSLGVKGSNPLSSNTLFLERDLNWSEVKELRAGAAIPAVAELSRCGRRSRSNPLSSNTLFLEKGFCLDYKTQALLLLMLGVVLGHLQSSE